jgi:hypothetical protein
VTLLYVLSGIVLSLFALLALPVEIDYTFDSESRPRSAARIVWLLGLVRSRPGSREGKKHRGEARKKAAPKGRRARKSSKAREKGFKVFLAAIRSEGFIRRVFKLLHAIFSATEIKRLRARFLLGLDDPADTGLVYGLLAPALSLFHALPRADFAAVPVFDRSALEANMNIRLRLVPINYLKAAVAFIFSMETLRAAMAAYGAYRK